MTDALDESTTQLWTALRRNRTLVTVLAGAEALGLPNWYLAAGCLTQTVWNVSTGRASDTGIRDYDLVYFDDTDLSWAAEDHAIRSARCVFGDLPVEVRNQARVHLWYEEKFGIPCPPYQSTEHAIGTFPTTATSVGVRIEAGERRVHAPFGLADLLGFQVRANPVLAPRSVYEAKTARWKRTWPELVVHPWPAG